MQPSSLIFLVIIAIWAAYFVQHWVRRREHLATVRSVDQFTESMRVLERRSPLVSPDLSEPQPRSYSVSPARASRPQVLVKRAAQSAAPSTGLSAGETGTGSVPEAPLPSRRRARGLVFLVSLATLPATVALAVLAVVPWLALVAPVAVIAAAMTWMRRGARAERAARRETNRRQHAQRQDHEGRETHTPAGASAHAPGHAGRAVQRPAPSATAVAAGTDSDAPVPEGTGGPAVPFEGPAEAETGAGSGAAAGADTERRRDRGALYDIQAVERAVTEVSPEPAPKAGSAATLMPLVDEDDIPLTWDPVPVPRPTYTMKAMAQRHAPAPVGQGVPPELAEPAYEEPVRHVAGA